MPTTEQQLNRWFRSRGLPHTALEYSPRRNVLNRMLPYLGLIWLYEMFGSFNDSLRGWSQAAAFLVSASILVGVFVGINKLLGRRWFARPDTINFFEIAAWAITPAIIPLLFSNDGIWTPFLDVVLTNVILFGIGYFVTSYGLLPALRVATIHTFKQAKSATQLVGRGLPLLMLITAFAFINAEMWQIAHDFTVGSFIAACSMLLGLAGAFLLLQLRAEIDELGRFYSWDEINAICATLDCPTSSYRAPASGVPPPPEFDRYERFNLGLLLMLAQLVQLAMIGGAVTAFYVIFGLVTVGEETINDWLASPPDLILVLQSSGDFSLFLTAEHLIVAGFVAAFSVLQFAVASVTDTTYRKQFFAQVTADVREVLAVRALVRYGERSA